jgi:hypothetical protein
MESQEVCVAPLVPSVTAQVRAPVFLAHAAWLLA